MFIRSMDWDYQVLSVIQKNEFYAGYLCRKFHVETQAEDYCFLHAFLPDAYEGDAKNCLMQLAAKKEPVDLKDSFLSDNYLYLEFPYLEGTAINDALASLSKEVNQPSLKERVMGITPADNTLTERIAMCRRLMEVCLAKRLPTGILAQVLVPEKLYYNDGQFDFSYKFAEPEKIFDDRIGQVSTRLGTILRQIIGTSLLSKAGEPFLEWIQWIENPSSGITVLSQIYPSFYEALEALENADPADKIVISALRKKVNRGIQIIGHILSPVPLCESDYVVIGSYHVFTKFLILAAAAAAAAVWKLLPSIGL